MTTTSGPANSDNAFLRTTDIFPSDPGELLIKLTHSYTESAQAINVRDISLYDQVELLNGQQFFTIGDPQTKRYVYRKCFAFGAILSGVTLPIPTGITGITTITRIYGTCITSVSDYLPIPFSSVIGSNHNVSIWFNGGTVNIANGAGADNITSGIVVMEYLKN